SASDQRSTKKSTSFPARGFETSSSEFLTGSPSLSLLQPACPAPNPLPASSSSPVSRKSLLAPSPWALEGTYLAAQSEADHYMRELKREEKEIIDVPDLEAAECGEILAQYGVEAEEAEPVVRALTRNPHHWVRFMMKGSNWGWKNRRRRGPFRARQPSPPRTPSAAYSRCCPTWLSPPPHTPSSPPSS
ncbi:unnamed protein product, partial [Linum tenue]